MLGDREIESLLFRSMERMNLDRAPGDQVEVSLETPLFGPGARLDSLALVSLVVDVEQALEAEHGLAVNLTDDRMLSRPVSSFTTVRTLRDAIREVSKDPE